MHAHSNTHLHARTHHYGPPKADRYRDLYVSKVRAILKTPTCIIATHLSRLQNTTRTNTDRHTHTHTHQHTYARRDKHSLARTRVRIHTGIHTHTYTLRTHNYTRTHSNTHTYTRIHSKTHTRTQTHTHVWGSIWAVQIELWGSMRDSRSKSDPSNAVSLYWNATLDTRRHS